MSPTIIPSKGGDFGIQSPKGILSAASALEPTSLLEIVEAVCPVPAGVAVQVSIQPEQQRTVVQLKHTAIAPNGKSYDFSYQINFDLNARRVDAPRIPVIGETNEITIPLSKLASEEGRTQVQDTLRRAFIADPLLNKRFSGSFELAPFQVKAQETMNRDLDEKGRALLVICTGGGKSEIALSRIEDELLAQLSLPLEQRSKVVFCVNNTTILADIEEKIKRRFGEKFSVSHCFGGNADYSGDIILATPDTLENRIESLLDQHKICLWVEDETHHLPAQTNKTLRSIVESKNKGIAQQTKFLGLTGTESRPDGESVIDFYGSDISFEYSARDGWREGYLVQVKYHAGDLDINSGRFPVVPGSAGYEQFQKQKHSESRFPHIFEQWRTQADKKDDKTTLAICADVNHAQAMAKYFKDQGVHAISLTSQDRAADPERFEHCYQAFKTGSWPKSSPYASEPVPEVVCAVDIFKEGTDAPRIQNLLLCADTNSVIAFVQSLGRGLRPAPFKTHLDVIDSVGLYRKLNLLNYLYGQAFDQRDSESSSEDSDRPTKAFDHDVSVCGLQLSDDVTQMVLNYYDNLPSHLEFRYGAYSLVPAREHGKLDSFLVDKMGFADVAELDGFLQGVAEALQGDALFDAEKANLREKFVKVFESILGLHADSPVLEVTGGVLLAYHRIQDKLNILAPEFSSEKLAQILPEFSAKDLDMYSRVADNLCVVRKAVFGADRQQMLGKIQTEVLTTAGMAKEVAEKLEMFFGPEFVDSDSNPVAIAEGKSVESQSGQKIPRDYRILTSVPYQEALVLAYLNHPELNKKIKAADFQLDPSDFKELLAKSGLIANQVRSATSIGRQIDSFVDNLNKLAQNTEPAADTVKTTLSSLTELLQSEGCKKFASPYELTELRLEKMWSLFDTLHASATRLQPQAPDEILLAEEALNDLMEWSQIRMSYRPQELDGAEITISRNKFETLQLTCTHRSLDPDSQRHLTFSQLDSTLISSKGIRIFRSEPKEGTNWGPSDIEMLYHKLPERAASHLGSYIQRAVERALELFGEDRIIQMPADKEDSGPLTSVRQRLLHQGTMVLGPTREIQGGSLMYNYREMAAESRIPSLSSQDRRAIKEFVDKQSAGQIPASWFVRALHGIDERKRLQPILTSALNSLELVRTKANEPLVDSAIKTLRVFEKDGVHNSRGLMETATTLLGMNEGLNLPKSLGTVSAYLRSLSIATEVELVTTDRKDTRTIRGLSFRVASMNRLIGEGKLLLPNELAVELEGHAHNLYQAFKKFHQLDEIDYKAIKLELDQTLSERCEALIKKLDQLVAPIVEQEAKARAAAKEQKKFLAIQETRAKAAVAERWTVIGGDFDEPRLGFPVVCTVQQAKTSRGKKAADRETFSIYHASPNCEQIREQAVSGTRVRFKSRLDLEDHHQPCPHCNPPSQADIASAERKLAIAPELGTGTIRIGSDGTFVTERRETSDASRKDAVNA